MVLFPIIYSVGLGFWYLNLYLDSYPQGTTLSRLMRDIIEPGLDGPDCPKGLLFHYGLEECPCGGPYGQLMGGVQPQLWFGP